ncbi:hypothetical protein [Micromonospora chersina]|uniref:hypothetical protein n=1 Tax=Micromonospora chersina TaxID=47854 RepID=UPI00371A1DE0
MGPVTRLVVAIVAGVGLPLCTQPQEPVAWVFGFVVFFVIMGSARGRRRHY